MFVDLGIDSGTDRVVVVPLFHFRKARTPACLNQPLYKFEWDTTNNLSLFDTWKRLPEVVETVKHGSSLNGCPAGIPFNLDNRGSRSRPRRCDRCDHTAGACTDDDDIVLGR